MRAFAVCAFLAWCASCSSAQEYSQAEAREARRKIIDYSKQYVGVPYKWGGTGPDGMDCSGFIYTVVRNAIDMQLPRTAAQMYAYARIIPDGSREPGDLVFFKTTGGSHISHAGIYLGSDQFIHSASDGPQTGVIISSLKESYWQRTYAASGQILPSGGEPESLYAAASAAADGGSREAEHSGGTAAAAVQDMDAHNADGARGSDAQSGGFLHNLAFDASLGLDWNIGAAGQFVLNIRGVSFELHAAYTGWQIAPGFGIACRYDHMMSIVQLPLVFSLSLPHGFRAYIGPVFTFGDAVQPRTDSPAAASIFPGIIGVSWQSPAVTVGKVSVSFMQDIGYTVFNKPDGSALSVSESLCSGLVFSTGVRVSLPLSRLL